MRFATPELLWFLLLVPALGAFFVWSWRVRRELVTRFVQARLLDGLIVGLSTGLRKFRLGLIVTTVALLLVAMARPQWGFEWEEARQRGLDVVVAIDASRSMLAQDVPPNRLARAKLAALDLMRVARTDRLGLVAFAGTAFLQCPLTLDEDAFRQSVDVLDPGVMPQGGTALAEAIGTALGAFKSEGDNHKVLVLLTDGEDQDSGAIEVAQRAAEKGLRIFTIGIGTPAGELIRLPNDKGQATFLKDDGGNVVKSRLNETLLQQIAGAANGFYLPLRGADTIETLYQRGLAPLPKSEVSSKLVRNYHDRYAWPLALALLILAIEAVLPDRLRLRRRGRNTAASRSAVAGIVAGLLLGAVAASPLQASSSKALREYNAGRYTEALREYSSELKRKPDDARLHFNAGDAAYRAGQFDAAANFFSGATGSTDPVLQQQALYNLGNSLFRIGEAATEAEQKTQSWDQAIQQYEKVLKLNPNDADARFNGDYVRKKLEELKQQQQKSPQQDKKDQQKDDQNKDEEQKDQQPKDDQQQQSQDKQDQSKQDQQSKEDQSKQDSQQGKKPDSEQQKPQEPQQQPGDQKPDGEDSQSPEPKSGDKNAPKDGSKEPPSGAAGGMMRLSPEQAKQLLESLKGEEKALIFLPPEARTNRTQRRFKDW